MTTSVFLNNDRTMPLLGLGLYKTTDAVEAEDAIAAAVQNGYRLLDTASAYKNEEFVGRGMFQEKTFLSQPRSGTMLSVLVM